MRTAVIADVHGNLPALEAVLREAEDEGFDELVCLGDLALFGPHPAECVDRLRAYGDRIRIVQGNADRYLAEGRTADAMVWCAARLGPERVAWLGTLATSQRIAHADALCVHATPRSDEEAIGPDSSPEERLAALAGVPARMVLHGHTHVQYWLVDGDRVVGNPGSVGFPFDGEQRAAWALVDGSDLNLRRTRYGVGDAIAALEASDNPFRETAIRRLREAAE